MLPDYQKIAEKIVNKCIKIQPDEVVLLIGGVFHLELLEELDIAIRKTGAFPVLMPSWDSLSYRIIHEVPEKYLKKVPVYMLKWLEDVTAAITIDAVYDPSIFEKLSEEKLGLSRTANEPIKNRFIIKKIRWSGLGFPTKPKAKIFKIDFDEFNDMFWKAVDVDYELLYKTGIALKNIFKKAEKIKITSKKGTNLKFYIGNRNICIDDGIISKEDIEEGFVGNNLPAGEVFIPPLEHTVEGVAIFDIVYYHGHKIEDLKLEFKNGKLINSSARTNHELFKKVLLNSTGSYDMIGEFGIGTNPAITTVTGYTHTDEKIIGSIHLALGENKVFGGNLTSSLHWDLVMLSPTVEAENKLIMEEGKLKV